MIFHRIFLIFLNLPKIFLRSFANVGPDIHARPFRASQKLQAKFAGDRFGRLDATCNRTIVCHT